jgi:hypothetical protein
LRQEYRINPGARNPGENIDEGVGHMNKKYFVIGVLSLAVLSLSLAGMAFAQGQPPPPSEYPYGPDMMNGYGGHDYGIRNDGMGR